MGPGKRCSKVRVDLVEETVSVRELVSINPQLVEQQSIFSAASLIGESGAQVFEPVVNVPALSAFVVIAAVFTLLQIRISAVSNAAQQRSTALDALREIKSQQLSADNLGEAGRRPSEEDVSRALSRYEEALREEADLREILPGVRVVAPNNNPEKAESDAAAARQFLGLDIEGIENQAKQNPDAGAEAEQSRKQELGGGVAKNGFSNGAIAILAVVALSQLALLYLLSFDPMTANNVFTSVAGPPSVDLPLSSW